MVSFDLISDKLTVSHPGSSELELVWEATATLFVRLIDENQVRKTGTTAP